MMPKISTKFQCSYPNGGAKYMWGVLISVIFDRYLTVF